MTRFDEALGAYAKANERQMSERVGAFSSRYVTVQEVGRGRARRLTLQSVAAVAAIAVVGAGGWYAAGQLRTPGPASPTVDSVPYLGDPAQPDTTAFQCGLPLPATVKEGVTVASGGQEVPTLTQTVTGSPDDGGRVLDLAPGATTLLTESGVSVTSTATWVGDEPQFWGLINYGVLVDGKGSVVARTSEVERFSDAHGVEPSTFEFTNGSCTTVSEDGVIGGPEYLDGPYAIHIVTQLWVDNSRNPVAMWVDQGLPANAQLTFDWDAYQAELDRQAQAFDDEADQVKAVIAGDGATLATLDGTGLIARVSPCALATTMASHGVAGVPAMPAAIPTAPVTWSNGGFSWTYDDADDPGWSGNSFAVVFLDSTGAYATTALARAATESQGPDGSTATAQFYNDMLTVPGCESLGTPTAPGTYSAYLVVEDPGLLAELAPASLQPLGDFAHVSTWIPVGAYQVP